MNPNLIEVTGPCDGGCGKDAKHWFGSTASAYCGDSKCLDKLNESWERHCEEYDRNARLEQEMRDEYGWEG